MKTLVRVLFLSAALAACIYFVRKSNLHRPVVRFFKPAVKLGEYRDPTLEAIKAYEQGNLALLSARDFAGLEARAREALAKKEQFDNGTWKLATFYHSFEPDKKAADAVWLARFQELNAWLNARPSSGPAYIALAGLHTDYAWKARGSGYADKVTQQGWRLFAERLNQAQRVLERGNSVAKGDPHYWRTYQTVALGLGWSREHKTAFLANGLAIEPKYTRLYFGHAWMLLPRWGGRPGEMEAFALKAAQMPNGLGNEIYARIAFLMDDAHEDIFRQTKLEWPKVEAGCKELLEKYPDEPSIISHCALVACRAGDTTTARKLFADLDDRIDFRIWKNEEFYKRHYNHANPGTNK